jgi:hypothetical protein
MRSAIVARKSVNGVDSLCIAYFAVRQTHAIRNYAAWLNIVRNAGQAGDAAAASGNACSLVKSCRGKKNKAWKGDKGMKFTSGRHGDLLICPESTCGRNRHRQVQTFVTRSSKGKFKRCMLSGNSEVFGGESYRPTSVCGDAPHFPRSRRVQAGSSFDHGGDAVLFRNQNWSNSELILADKECLSLYAGLR